MTRGAAIASRSAGRDKPPTVGEDPLVVIVTVRWGVNPSRILKGDGRSRLVAIV